jgi:serine/threonine protein phosphatase PrpC
MGSPSAAPRPRKRLARGPLTIGEPAPAIDAQLAATEPYRPDLVADGGSAFGLQIRAASVRGLQKRYLGGARQDDLCLRVHQPSRTVIAAVADGVSGAPRSDLGAALAVRYATAGVARQLEAGQDEVDWEPVFNQAAWALVEEHRRLNEGGDVDAASGSLATTLLVAAVRADGDRGVTAQLAAVGDSPALMLARRRFEPIVGERERTDGLLGGGVQALPRAARPAHIATRAFGPGTVLLLCTDGLSLPLAGGTSEVALTFARELSRPPDISDFARLLDFSRSTYDDDRTLVAIWGEQ